MTGVLSAFLHELPALRDRSIVGIFTNFLTLRVSVFAPSGDFRMKLMPDDSSLLHDFLEQGSGAAFAAIVSRYLPMVYGTALRTLAGDRHAADDVAQQVFIALIANAGRLTQNRSIAGWLHGTAHNLAVNRIRSDRRRAEREQEAILREDTNAAVSAIGDE